MTSNSLGLLVNSVRTLSWPKTANSREKRSLFERPISLQTRPGTQHPPSFHPGLSHSPLRLHIWLTVRPSRARGNRGHVSWIVALTPNVEQDY